MLCAVSPSNFYVYDVGTKISFKICVHVMKTPKTCHNFQIYIKIGTTCICLVVAILFRSVIKIGLHACVWCGTRLNACSCWRDDIQSHTYFYVTLYIYLCQHQDVFNGFHVESVFTLITVGLYAQN
jgi:hypothetical protein